MVTFAKDIERDTKQLNTMVDYSKWKKIEISDDEDDTHPNIDTGSLFRWRHQARVQRLEERRTKQQELVDKEMQLVDNLKTLDIDGEDYGKKSEELNKIKQEREAFERRERLLPWDVDTISKDGWSKTVLNKGCLTTNNSGDKAEPSKACAVHPNKSTEDLDDTKKDEIEETGEFKAYGDFINLHEPKIREFGFRSRFEDCRRYLLAHPEIVSQHTFDYLCLWCMQLMLENKQALLEHVARQTVVLQMLLDLAKSLDNIDPRSCLPSFFSKAQRSLDKFEALVADELVDFRGRVQKAADMRLERAIKEQEEKPQSLLGPGGLNAQEVFESLPQKLQDAFVKRDDQLLQAALDELEPSVAKYHMERCIDSGLWVPKGGKTSLDEDELLFEKVAKDQPLAAIAEDSEDSEVDQ